MTVRLEWKPQDLWVGVYWRRGRVPVATRDGVRARRLVDVWICVVPCLPLHLRWTRPLPDGDDW